MEDVHRRIVLLGKTGTGKSSLANTIFGVEDLFKVSHGSVSETNVCESKTRNINGKNIQLIDTPGLFDTDPKSTELSPELLKCLQECAPGPHAFLIVLKVERFTRQEQATIDIILKYFSEEALKYTTVVFTHGEQMPEGKKIEDWVRENEALGILVEKCGGRCHVFDNKYWKKTRHEVQKLLATIDQTVEKNGGGYYTNELLRMIDDETQQEVNRCCLSCPGITMKDIYLKAKATVFTKLWKNMESVVTGVLLGALLGAAAGVMITIMLCPGLVQCVSAGVTGAAVGGGTGALAGAWCSEHWATPTEAVQDATKFLGELESLALQGNKTLKAFAPGRLCI